MSRFKLLSWTAIAVVLISGMTQAHEFGMGAIMGDPTGLNAKVWTGYSTAVDFAAAWSIDSRNSFNFHMDYLFHDYGVFNVTKGKLPLYYGIGGRFRDAADSHVGVRFPIGVNYLFARSPLDVFFEVAPVMDLTPKTDFDLDAGIGMRFYFK